MLVQLNSAPCHLSINEIAWIIFLEKTTFWLNVKFVFVYIGWLFLCPLQHFTQIIRKKQKHDNFSDFSWLFFLMGICISKQFRYLKQVVCFFPLPCKSCRQFLMQFVSFFWYLWVFFSQLSVSSDTDTCQFFLTTVRFFRYWYLSVSSDNCQFLPTAVSFFWLLAVSTFYWYLSVSSDNWHFHLMTVSFFNCRLPAAMLHSFWWCFMSSCSQKAFDHFNWILTKGFQVCNSTACRQLWLTHDLWPRFQLVRHSDWWSSKLCWALLR